MSDFLLEIGCENLPPAGIRPAFEQLAKSAAERLTGLRLPFESVYATGTPRRLVLIVRGLSPTQTSASETVTGPPVSKAYDESGRPTKAAVGFARSHGVGPDKLKRVSTDRGEYVGFTKRLKSRRASVLLRELVPELIAELRFPKVMRWEETDVRFARPIRWIVCLLGAQLIRLRFAGVTSGRVTHVAPWIHRDNIRVTSVAQYGRALAKAGVVLDHGERRDRIAALAERAAAKRGLRVVAADALIDELTFMLENPRPLVGEFDEDYLKLPAEVVVTAMKSHQRYLAFRSKRGRLVPAFLTFTEGRPGSPAVVRRGNEKVLKARLEDALFYWQEDLKTGLKGLSDKLGSIVFIEGLGSLGDKAGRIERLARFIGAALPEGERPDEADIERAARLAKADLASEMIRDGKEFTLLEGLIGSRYAQAAHESDAVVTALREQYLPRSAADALPSTPLGAVLSMADKIDTIVGCFIAGLVPTGSQDPYALRRQGNGLLRMLERRPELSLEAILDASLDAYGEAWPAQGAARAEVRAALVDFFKLRVETFLKDNGIAYDVVAAVAAVAWARPGAALERGRVIGASRGDRAFELLITGAKRVGNILSPEAKVYGADWDALQAGLGLDSAGGRRFDPALFEDDAEGGLYEAVRAALPRLRSSEARADVAAALQTLSDLGPTIDAYFDRVLVNCPDSRLRENRHRFLAAVFAVFSKYADFSHIVEEGKVSVG